jgi:4-amino-4-deoxy-L-arabinose transferase-like glycosyltransferase
MESNHSIMKSRLFSNYIKSHQSVLYGVIFILIFISFLFLRFYKMSTWADLGWDQLDSAWAAVRILHEHNYPLQGMNSKGNSGLFVGPLYYYLVAGFYFLTNFDPIASPLLATFAAVISFFTLYICIRNLHGRLAGTIAIFMYTFSIASIFADRVQWSPNFIPPISLMLFYCLYKGIQGNPKYLLWVGLLIGLTWNLHFIVFFFVAMTFLALPFFPRTRQTLVFGLGAVCIIGLFLLPNLIAEIQRSNSSTIIGATAYTSSYYHGFHLRRFIQLTHDAFIDVLKILPFWFIGNGIYVVPVLYSIVLWFSADRKKTLVLSYLVFVWLIVPWLAFTAYSGEITDYYFSSFRYIAIMMCAYLLSRAIKGFWLARILAVVFLGYYAYSTLSLYSINPGNMIPTKQYVRRMIEDGKEIPFVEGKLDSYLYYVYTKILPKAP